MRLPRYKVHKCPGAEVLRLRPSACLAETYHSIMTCDCSAICAGKVVVDTACVDHVLGARRHHPCKHFSPLDTCMRQLRIHQACSLPLQGTLQTQSCMQSADVSAYAHLGHQRQIVTLSHSLGHSLLILELGKGLAHWAVACCLQVKSTGF